MSYIHFNRLGGENLLSFNGPHVVPIAITQQPSQGACAPNQAPTTCFRTTQQGYPEGLNVPANFNPLNGRVNYIPSDLNTGYVQSWHVTVQRELLSNLLVDVAYIGNKSDNLMILGDLNQARPNNRRREHAAAGAPADPGLPVHPVGVRRRPGQLPRAAGQGGAPLDARPLSAELVHVVAGAATTPRGISRRPTATTAASTTPTSTGEWGLSGYNQPLNNTTSVVWELPFGRDRRWANELHPVVEGIVGGWRMTAINTMTSGLPVNLTYSPSLAVLGERRADLSSERHRRHLRRRGRSTTSSIATTSPFRPTGRSRSATRRATSRVGRRSTTLDLGLHKSFGLGLGREPARGPHRGVQRAEQDQFRRAER